MEFWKILKIEFEIRLGVRPDKGSYLCNIRGNILSIHV